MGRCEGEVGLGWMGTTGLWKAFCIRWARLGLNFQDGKKEPLWALKQRSGSAKALPVLPCSWG